MPPSSAAASAASSAAVRTGSSIVRCARCGETQRVELAQSVLAQVRPFVRAHLLCGVDAVTVPAAGKG